MHVDVSSEECPEQARQYASNERLRQMFGFPAATISSSNPYQVLELEDSFTSTIDSEPSFVIDKTSPTRNFKHYEEDEDDEVKIVGCSVSVPTKTEDFSLARERQRATPNSPPKIKAAFCPGSFDRFQSLDASLFGALDLCQGSGMAKRKEFQPQIKAKKKRKIRDKIADLVSLSRLCF